MCGGGKRLGKMLSIVIVIMLLIMGVIDIKKNAVPLWLLITFFTIAVGIRIIINIDGNQKFEIKQLIFIICFMILTFFISVWGQMLGLADMMVFGMLAVLVGEKRTLEVFLISLFLVSIIAGILLILRRVRAKDRIPFLPFVFLAYLGVAVCG